LCQLRDTLEDQDRVKVEKCTGRLSLSEPRYALGGRNRASLEMHLEGIIVQTWGL
jgi:hypothetical protein